MDERDVLTWVIGVMTAAVGFFTRRLVASHDSLRNDFEQQRKDFESYQLKSLERHYVKDEIDRKIEKLESTTDARISEIRHDLRSGFDSVNKKLDSLMERMFSK